MVSHFLLVIRVTGTTFRRVGTHPKFSIPSQQNVAVLPTLVEQPEDGSLESVTVIGGKLKLLGCDGFGSGVYRNEA
jgi:hypothetical protein